MRTKDRLRRDRGQGRGAARRRARPAVEGLEGRQLLYATTGAAWPHPNLITFSFVPDGTTFAGYPSGLFQALNAKFPTATWQGVFEQAAAIWEQVANVNLSLVGDNGAPMDSGPYQQGNTSFGDIRIGGLPSSVIGSGTLGYTFLPPPLNGDEAAGDIIMNTSQAWQINSDYDLLTVAIHEMGHALGMGHSAMAAADMYAVYNGVKQTLTGDDVLGIQSIYGPRATDGFMAVYGNTNSAHAADLTPYLNLLGQFSYPSLDIQDPHGAEWFKVTVPLLSTGTMTLTMQSSGLSLLSPSMGVWNSSLQLLGGNADLNSYGSTVSVKVVGVLPGQTYYISTAGASSTGATGDGAYGLQVNFSLLPLAPFSPPVTATANTADFGGGFADTAGGNGHGHGNGHGQGHDHGKSGSDSGLVSFGDLTGDAFSIAGDGSDDSGAATASVTPATTAADPSAPLLLIAPAVTDDDGGTVVVALTPAGPLKASKAARAWNASPSN